MRMNNTPKAMLSERGSGDFVGRRNALARLGALVEDAWPVVSYIHGIPGVGKSSLINVFCNGLDRDKTEVILLDGEAIEPTSKNFLRALADSAKCDEWTIGKGPEGHKNVANRTLIAVDNYEHLLLLDDWLRAHFLPSLTANMRLVLVSRLPPNMGWTASPTSQRILDVLALDTLTPDEVVQILSEASLSAHQIALVARLAQGHPLTLVLAIAALNNAAHTLSIHDELAKVLHELARYFLKDIKSEALREAVELAAVARRLDRALLSHVLPRIDAAGVYDELTDLPFIEQRADGLKLHQVISGVVLSIMETQNPDDVIQKRRSIWQFLKARDLNNGQKPTWRSTVDMIYQLHKPVVREAFFPTDASPMLIGDARADDFSKVLDIAKKHDGSQMANIVALWWQQLPGAFRVVRDGEDEVVGFYFATDDRSVSPLLRANDPLLDAWMSNAAAETQGDERSLFVRRWLSLSLGEAPSPEQGACWIDLKKVYLEMRPDLRRVYVCAYDPAPYAPALVELQFQVLGNIQVKATNNPPTTAMLDFGPASVDGWLSMLVGEDLNANSDLPFDFLRREIIVNNMPAVAMTKREFEVVGYLVERRGIAVTRDMLLDDVWGQQHHGGSNVVDVAIRSLRRKLGAKSDLIETVRSVGYRIN